MSSKEERDDVERLGALAAASAALVDATVALSLERSVTQVSLAYPEPAPSAFREIIAQQRALADTAFSSADAVLADAGLAETSALLKPRLDADRATVATLRAEADAAIARPAVERDAERARALPLELKLTISRMNAALKLLHPRTGVSTARAQALATLQDRAWEAREHGGRARTYFAIAVLNGAPISDADVALVLGDNKRALDAWDRISSLATAVALDGAPAAAIEEARSLYFDQYADLIDRILATSRQAAAIGVAPDYGMSFEAFFATSNRALDTLSQLSKVAGEERIRYWASRKEAASQDFFRSVLIAIGSLSVALGSVWMVQALVSSRLASVSSALGAVAQGAEAQGYRPRASDLVEVRQLSAVLVAFQSKQAALNHAEEQRRAAETARKVMLADLQDALGRAVQAAMSGDLDARLRTDFADAELRALAGDVNALLADTAAGMASASAALEALSKGELGVRMRGELRGAFAALRGSFEQSLDGLAAAMREVESVARGVGGATAAITDGAQDLISRAEAQAEALERTNGTLADLSETVRRNREAAKTAKDLSARNAAAAETGAEEIRTAVEAMQRIEQSATKIGAIVGVIDSIAFQTNLLALNASVEAARAGEAGRGFAVVASEVRGLAQRSADAARDIRALIADSGSRVAQGVSLVERTGASLGEMRDLAAEAASRVDDINRIGDEQQVGLHGINAAMGALDRLTRATADQAAQTGDRARELEAGARKLNEAVSAFDVPRFGLASRAA